MTNAIKTANGTRIMTAEAVKAFADNQAGLKVSISTDHPMIRHSAKPLPWGHDAKWKGCVTWGDYNDLLGLPPSPDHYFVGG